MRNLNKEIKKLEETFEKFVYGIYKLHFKSKSGITHKNIYDSAKISIQKQEIIPTVELIEEFSRNSLKKYSENEFRYEFEHLMGHFLSALSNLTQENETIIIKTKNLKKKMNNLGCFLMNANIEVRGDVGDRAGMAMIDGNLTIKGNAGSYLGTWMNGGEIEVYGNVEDSVGDEMKDGLIEIFGNAGDFVGYNMKGGKIVIHGKAGKLVGVWMNDGKIYLNTYTSISSVRYGGKIYRKGKLVKQKILEGPRYFRDFIKTIEPE
jgi:formylmethanofuran dehydrogenase subunit C